MVSLTERRVTHLCPTFDDAVTRHRMLDAIETAAATGQRQTLVSIPMKV